MKTITVPKLKDPRWLILTFFVIAAVEISFSAGFPRTLRQYAMAAGICITLDFLMTWAFQRKLLLPVSGFISAFGIFVMVDSPFLWPTALAAVLAITSKQLLRVGGRHIFNPGNFGIVITLLSFPDITNLSSHRWAGGTLAAVLLFSLGTLLVLRVQRHLVCFSYLLGFIFFSFLRSLFLGESFVSCCLSLTGPAMQLFIFFMVSDPRTSPIDRWRQIVFGLALALVDNIFRQGQFADSPLIALFLITLLFNTLRVRFPEKSKFTTWQTRTVELGATL